MKKTKYEMRKQNISFKSKKTKHQLQVDVEAQDDVENKTSASSLIKYILNYPITISEKFVIEMWYFLRA